MRLGKIAQVYASLLSIFLLAVVGIGTYMWQSGAFSSQADESVRPTNLPIINLETPSTTIKNNADVEISVVGDFEAAPVTSGNIIISYPPDLLDVESITSDDGILRNPTSQIINEDKGLITMSFSSLTGIATTGPIAIIKAKAKEVGLAQIIVETEPTSTAQSVTQFTSLESVDATPIVFGASLTIE